MSDLSLPIPAAALHVWNAFQELDGTRNSNGYSMLSLTFTDIDAYARLSGFPLAPWEVKAIRQMDAIRIASFNADQTVAPTDAPPAESERTMTPALFGALFG